MLKEYIQDVIISEIRSQKIGPKFGIQADEVTDISNSGQLGLVPGADPGFDQGGAQIVTGLKLPFWGLSFVEFWCWGLSFGGQGGAWAPGAPPGSAPESSDMSRMVNLLKG